MLINLFTCKYFQAALRLALQVLGVHGFGGIGKTTLATALYNHLYLGFGQRHTFLSIDRNSTDEQIMQLQNRLLEKLCGDRAGISSMEEGRQRLRNALMVGSKVLMVLDNLWDRKQRDALLPDSLPDGSLVIMTARDKSLLTHGGRKHNQRPAVSGLPDEEALKLLSLHAFSQPTPKDGFKEVAEAVVTACHGVPVALEVTGSFLKDKEQEFWEVRQLTSQ